MGAPQGVARARGYPLGFLIEIGYYGPPQAHDRGMRCGF